MSREATSRPRSGGARPLKARPAPAVVATQSALFSVQDRRHHHKVLHETQQRRARLLPLGTRDIALHQYLLHDDVHTVLDEGVLEARTQARANRLARHPSKVKTSSAAVSTARVQFASDSAEPLEDLSRQNVSNPGKPVASTEADESSSLMSQLRAAAESRYTSAPAPRGHGLNAPHTTATHGASYDTQLSQSSATQAPAWISGSHTRDAETAANQDEATDWLDSEEPVKEMDYEAWLAAGCPTGCWKNLLENELYGPARAEKEYYGLKYRTERT